MRRSVVVGLMMISAAAGLPRAQRAPSPAVSATEWRFYGGDAGSTKYSPLDQVTAANVSRLETAWRWTSPDNAIVAANPETRPGAYEDTPIMANGVLYTATSLGVFVALDPGTGTVLWQFDPETWKLGRPPNLGYTHRGVAYWTDGRAERIISGIHDAHLISIDAKTGRLDPDFGVNGMVDAIAGLQFAERMKNYAINSTPVIVKDVVIAGANISDGPQTREYPRGDVSGYDVRTGKRLWTFQSVPAPGQFGNETWKNDSWAFTGSTNVWSLISADENLGYVYLPFGTPTDDYYGGNRPGDNLFAESLVCLDVKTGRRVWHFQGVHHGLWDYDFPAAPVLGDIIVDGRRISAVAQVSKQGFVYLLDRRTGAPVWPIEERAVRQSTLPRERTSPTQPFPTRPPAFERQGLTDDNLIDYTPELRARAVALLKDFDRGPLFTPPSDRPTIQLPGNGGGANYNGAAFDPETRMLYVPSVTSPFVVNVAAQDPARGNLGYRHQGGATLPTIDGLPLVKGPYSRITAYDLDKGAIAWQIPIGDGPRDHPLIRDLKPGPLGSPGRGFVLLTKTLLFVSHQGRPAASPPEPASLRAIDKASGRIVATIDLPRGPTQSPMTYMYQGKQYIVLAIGGGANAELVAFTLRAADARD
jgi:quinoprotein glucose dehydrogenase